MLVDFYTGAEFLRTKQKTNPFFDPIIDVCNKNGIEWRILVPDNRIKCGYESGHIKSCKVIVLVQTWIWRISRLLWFGADWRVRRFAGKLIKLFWGDSFCADVAIVIAGGAECPLYWAVNAKRIVDLQHGVIYARHSGYFNSDGRFLGCANGSDIPNREFWVYGQGYADCFFKHPDNAKDLRDRVKIIGDVIRAGEYKSDGAMECGNEGVRNTVVFSAQLTADLARGEMKASVERMEEFFDEFFKKFGDRYECLIKQHPRFGNVYDMSGFFSRFPQVKETKEQWAELYPRMALHVTFMSTVTFDCASAGVPTYLLDFPAAKILNRDLFRDDYAYPYFDNTFEEILAIPVDETRNTMLQWYRKFYMPFSDENCLQLLNGNLLNERARSDQ